MRAATAIVGAIAISSLLIALAFVLSGGGHSDRTVVTKTVTERVEPQVGGPTQCDGGEVTVENVSCEVGEQVHRQYEEGGRGQFIAEDRTNKETITMSCEEAAPVTCSGPGGATVYFAP
jgi:hypothetical protein